MAYNLRDRFQPLPYPYRLFEPGAYQSDETCKIKLNKAPFLSKTKRNTQSGNQIWTHAIYHADPRRKIPNCTSLKSKIPRFPYEELSKEDIEAILCRCGRQNECECPDDDIAEEVNCSAKIHRRLYVGPPPREGSVGLSVPSRRDHGFEQMPDGTHKRIYKIESNLGPSFYDAEVIESTAFYRGCKWGQWRSAREMKALEKRPGPADYNVERLPTSDEICAEKLREHRRKYSKQMRYIEMIQRKTLLEGYPGPASYIPKYPKDPDTNFYGSKASRFRDSSYTEGPGPAAHWIKRDFDGSEPPTILCQAKLPEPSFFGVKAKRFKPRKEEGPSPSTYCPNIKQCSVVNCSPPPFGSSARRYKEAVLKNDDDDDDEEQHKDTATNEICPKPSWEFKSKSIRMKPLEKKLFEQSPADLPMHGPYPKRRSHLQYQSPFCSSEGRFQPWHNWLSVFGRLKTPGPGYYNSEKYKCVPAVCQGPIYRAERLSASRYQTPAPNAYRVGGGMETILVTHNNRLKHNLANKHKFLWKPRNKPNNLSYIEQEKLIIERTIAALNVDTDTEVTDDVKETADSGEHKSDVKANDVKPKLLNYFMFMHKVEPGF